MKKLRVFIILSLSLFSYALVSCDKDDDEAAEILPNQAVRGSFNGNEICAADTAGPYHVDIYNTASDTKMLWVDNIWGYGIKVKATADGNNFTISPQVTTDGGGDTLTVSGNGNVENGNLTFNFNLEYSPTDKYNCQFKGEKDNL